MFARNFVHVSRLALILFLLLFISRPFTTFAFSTPQGPDYPVSTITLPTIPAKAAPEAQYKLACFLLFSPHPDPVSAVAPLLSAAARQFAPAEFLLGYLYEKGKGVPVDYAQAAEYYRAAAQQGYAPAENNLGGLYHDGRGVPKDMTLAFEAYRAGALHGNGVAQYNLAAAYYRGYGTDINLAKAVEWFHAAAEQGVAAAQANLARLYFQGIGVPVDYAQTAHWALLAAQQGLPHAAMNYAYLCEHGLGVPRSYVNAYLWYSRALAGGDTSATAHLKEVSHHLSHSQRDQANSVLAADASHSQKPPAGGANSDLSLIENP